MNYFLYLSLFVHRRLFGIYENATIHNILPNKNANDLLNPQQIPNNNHIPTDIPTTDIATMQTTFSQCKKNNANDLPNNAMSIPKSPLKGLHNELVLTWEDQAAH